jgi:ABC-2 type transport system permease protein
MTAVTPTRPSLIRPSLVAAVATPPREHPVGLAKLTRVELRKAVDTRAGRWLLAALALVGIAAMAVFSFAGKPKDHHYTDIAGGGAAFVALLLPVLGILLVTSEWSQRTAQTTFTLVPRRGRVIAAKVYAAVALALAVGVLCLLVAVPFTLLASAPAGGAWSLGAAPVEALLYLVLWVLFGIAFGLLFVNSPIAIVVYFVLPTAWTIIGSSFDALHGMRDWLDSSTAFGNLIGETLTTTRWLQIAVCIGVWVLLPAVLGMTRVHRRAIS